jgi:hypothetical protein
MNKQPGFFLFKTRVSKKTRIRKKAVAPLEGGPMKRRICLFILLLLTGISAVFTAHAQMGYVSVFAAAGDDAVLSIAAWAGELYFLYDDKVYALAREGEAPWGAIEANGYDELISGGGNLFGVTFDRRIHPLQKKEDGSLFSLDSFALDPPSFDEPAYLDGAADEDRLFLLYGDSVMGIYEAELLTYDLKQGKQTSIPTSNVYDICGYKGGKLLVLTEDQMDRGRSKLLLLDPATGDREPFLDLPSGRASGLAYDAASDTICCAVETLIYRSVASGPFEACGVLPMDAYSINNCALFQGAYAITDYKNLFLCDTELDIGSLPTLNIYGTTAEGAKAAFKEAYPGVVIREEPFDMWQGDLAVSLITQSSQADIYVVPLALGLLPQLREKGFYVDLQEDTLLTSGMAKMLPALKDVFWQDGRLCAYPSQALKYGNVLCYNKTLWEELGFSVEDLPRTMPQFIDFTVRWMQEYAGQYPDIVPFWPLDNAKWQLHRRTIYQYTLAFAPDGEKPYFDVPLLQGILKKLDDAAPMLKELDRQCEASFTGDPETDPAVLFDFYGDLMPPEEIYQDWRPLLLTLGENDTPQETIQMDALVINPNSKNKDMALAFVECAAGAMDAQTKALLYADETMLVENPNYARAKERYQADKERLDGAIGAAAPEDKKALEDEMATAEEELAWWEENARWDVPPDTILRYKEITPYLRVDGEDTLFFDVFEAAGTLPDRYDDGQLSSLDYLKELERIYRMRSAE